MDEGGVVDPLVDGARGARAWEDVEARAGVAVAPGRGLDLELAQAGYDGVDIDAVVSDSLEITHWSHTDAECYPKGRDVSTS